MMNKKLIIILFSLAVSIATIKADPNTLANCATDKNCEDFLKTNQFACRKKPDYTGPVAKCKSTTLAGREVKYCVCEYTHATTKAKDTQGMNWLFAGCSNDNSCEHLGAACSTGALPQCDAVDQGICYCPF